ncbi:MAG: AraC family transcriptional regulator [Bacillota bacterium]
MPINNKSIQGYSPILHARSEKYFWKGKGALSIKTFKNGRAFYHAGHGHFAVDEGNYLLLIKSEYTNKYLDITWLEEKLYELAHRLLKVNRQVNKEILKLQSLRASSRKELYKRIHIGHEFISAYFDQSITLTDVARTACLSPNHFLRSYKQMFGISPHQYLGERRLQESKRLLLQTTRIT